MRTKQGTIFIVIGLLLMAAALCLTGYNLWENHRAEVSVSDTTRQLQTYMPTQPAQMPQTESESVPAEEMEIPDYILDPNRDMPVQNIQGYDYVGMLEIPALDLLLPVMAQLDNTRLQVAPCRYSGSPYLENFVIAAHNYPAHFGKLKNLNPGDEITFTDMDRNVFTYEVVALESLMSTAVEEMTAGEYDLSLFTCTVTGNYRVTVRCDLVKE